MQNEKGNCQMFTLNGDLIAYNVHINIPFSFEKYSIEKNEWQNLDWNFENQKIGNCFANFSNGKETLVLFCDKSRIINFYSNNKKVVEESYKYFEAFYYDEKSDGWINDFHNDISVINSTCIFLE